MLTFKQVSQRLDDIVKHFTPPGADPDSVIDRVLVIAGDRKKVEQEEIPEFFTPMTGRWKLKSEFRHDLATHPIALIN